MVELLNRRARRRFVPSLRRVDTCVGAGARRYGAGCVARAARDRRLVRAARRARRSPTPGRRTISGDIGLCCTGIATTGFGSVTQPAGSQYTGTGGVAATAQDDLDIAYANAAGQAITATLPVDLSLSGTPATPLLPGVYESTAHGSLQINTGLTLDFAGDPNAVFIFQGTDLTTAAAAAGSVSIVNGGAAPSACNVFWQLSSDATGVSLGTSSAFKGTTMALGASTLGNGATVEGRILTRRSKAVTLDANTITRSTCSTQTSPPPPAAIGATPTPASGGGTPTVTAPGPAGSPVGVVSAPQPAAATPPGTAKLVGPSGPVSNPFAVWVTGRAIDRVVFSVDGKRIGTVRAKRGRTKFKITITPRRATRGRVHRLTARITYKPSSRTSSTVRRTTYYTAGRAARTPQFAG